MPEPTSSSINDLAFIKELTKGKTYACDAIWKIDPFPRSTQKRHQSVYRSSFGDKTRTALQYNREVKTHAFNVRKTPLSDYVNALHNNKVFVNTQFTSC